MAEPEMRAPRDKTALVYLIMVCLAGFAIYGITRTGAGLVAPAPTSGSHAGAHTPANADVLMHVLLALLVIVAAARMCGAVFRRFAQPAVVGEVLAGIALGPSLLGRVAPHLSASLFPASATPSIGMIANVGVILFMFLVGTELDTGLLRNKAHSALAISHASILAPFLLGSVTSLWLYPALSSNDVPFTVFSLFMGVAMSITAFPVLARILTDRDEHKTKLGVIALSCAAIDDVTAWCLLAFVVSLASSHASGALITITLTFAYIAAVWFLLRPIAHRAIRQQQLRQQVGPNAVPLVIIGLVASALSTELIGIHAIFGAFLLGTIIPHDSLLAARLKERLEDLVVVLFLPAFFAFTGLRTQIGLVSTGEQWLMCGAITFVACLGKFGGTYAAARFTGLDRRESAQLGALMNTRGLMELVVLNLGLDLGVIEPTLFAMMIFMAVGTTMMTAPLLSLFQRGAAHPTKASSASLS